LVDFRQALSNFPARAARALLTPSDQSRMGQLRRNSQNTQLIGLDSQSCFAVVSPYAAFKPMRVDMETYKWEIVIVHPRGRLVGTVEAPDRETAIKIAIETFRITDPI
jgi:hypothetical protein